MNQLSSRASLQRDSVALVSRPYDMVFEGRLVSIHGNSSQLGDLPDLLVITLQAAREKIFSKRKTFQIGGSFPDDDSLFTNRVIR